MTKRKAKWIIGAALAITIAGAAISLLWPFITRTVSVEGTIT